MHINQHNWFYKVLDIPAIPAELEQSLWQLFASPSLEQHRFTHEHYYNNTRPELAHKPGPGEAVGIRNGKTFANCRGARYGVNQQMVNWVNENITKDYVDTGIYVINGDVADTVLPHTDQTRNFSLLYLLEPGGDSTHTDFWQETGEGIHREMKTFSGDYSRNNLLLSVQWPLRTWILLNTNILHSVEELSRKRLQYQVSLDVIPNVPVKLTKEI